MKIDVFGRFFVKMLVFHSKNQLSGTHEFARLARVARLARLARVARVVRVARGNGVINCSTQPRYHTRRGLG